jgi:hypothetical protein
VTALDKTPLSAGLGDLIGRLSVVPEGATGDFALGEDQGLGVGDAAVLAAAIFCRVDLLVTGDRKHFGRLLATGSTECSWRQLPMR